MASRGHRRQVEGEGGSAATRAMKHSKYAPTKMATPKDSNSLGFGLDPEAPTFKPFFSTTKPQPALASSNWRDRSTTTTSGWTPVNQYQAKNTGPKLDADTGTKPSVDKFPSSRKRNENNNNNDGNNHQKQHQAFPTTKAPPPNLTPYSSRQPAQLTSTYISHPPNLTPYSAPKAKPTPTTPEIPFQVYRPPPSTPESSLKHYLCNPPSQPYLRQTLQPLQPTPPRRLLLILDLNGTLVYRTSRSTYAFLPRPGLTDFLSYAFTHHAVMIWTSMQPQNAHYVVSRLLPPAQHAALYALWTRDTLGLTIAQYRAKTQTVKDLSKVWFFSKGEWDQTNTVLIDDSPLKAARQPFNALALPELDRATYWAEKYVEDGPEGGKLEDGQKGEDLPLHLLMRYIERARVTSDVSAFIRLNALFAVPSSEDGGGDVGGNVGGNVGGGNASGDASGDAAGDLAAQMNKLSV